ncbi:hypothetical protein QR680_005387 [Steinernema hermaphroditum]|uniref:Uncharacterized protein n=1 Tax=Steinernema hermaphroditum TaxID=289476 RepID=A0AA39HRU6_9BILA|nr:hypothetical protein QR680_005387 [Steinernema hermaphroditum]
MPLHTLVPSNGEDRSRSSSPRPLRQRSASLACPPPPPSVSFLKTNPRIVFLKGQKSRAPKEVSRDDVMDELCNRLVQRRKTLGFIGSPEDEEEREKPALSPSTLSTTPSTPPLGLSAVNFPPLPRVPPPPPLDVGALKANKFDASSIARARYRERSKSVFGGENQKNDIMEELKRRLNAPKRFSVAVIEKIEEESTERRQPNGEVTHLAVDLIHHKMKNPNAEHPSTPQKPTVHQAPDAVKKAVLPKPAKPKTVKTVVEKFSSLRVTRETSIPIPPKKTPLKVELRKNNGGSTSQLTPRMVNGESSERTQSSSRGRESLLVSKFVDIWETRQFRPGSSRASVTSDTSKK